MHWGWLAPDLAPFGLGEINDTERLHSRKDWIVGFLEPFPRTQEGKAEWKVRALGYAPETVCSLCLLPSNLVPRACSVSGCEDYACVQKCPSLESEADKQMCLDKLAPSLHGLDIQKRAWISAPLQCIGWTFRRGCRTWPWH